MKLVKYLFLSVLCSVSLSSCIKPGQYIVSFNYDDSIYFSGSTYYEEEINKIFKDNTNETLKYTDDPIVSSDIIGSSCGALVDGQLTCVLDVDGKQLVKVVAWYDNEMGYSYQMVRTAKKLMK